jgi:hypothetical protein
VKHWASFCRVLSLPPANFPATFHVRRIVSHFFVSLRVLKGYSTLREGIRDFVVRISV